MTAKTSKARTEAFFTALAETGNQTISAERACVSRSWVTLHRSTDPAFKVRMETCMAQAHVRLSAAEGIDPVPLLGAEWASLHGDALVVRMGKSGQMQVTRPVGGQFTAQLEEQFLGVLEETANVHMAHQQTGITSKAVYDHRKRWPGFDRRWKEALSRGRLRLEVGMIHSASLDPVDIGADLDQPLPPMSAAAALHILHTHKYAVHGLGKPAGLPPRAVDAEAVKVEILRKAEILRRAGHLVAKK